MFKLKSPSKLKKLVNKQTILNAVTAITFCLTLGIGSYQTAQAQGVQRQIDSMFNSMSNTTRPGVFETQRRGVISGGRYTLKNKVVNENIISFVPPSFSGSCNGIDIFGGSFSFINSEQLIALLRAVAANAAAYAFQLALDNICPNCSKHIAALQRSIQSLNEFMGNSCQLAKGIVNDTFEAFGQKKQGDESFVAQGKGLVAGFFDSWAHLGGESGGKTIEKNTPIEQNDFIGNVVWKQLKKQNTQSWFDGGDNELAEALMSLSGTVIVHPHKAAPDSTSGSSTPAESNEYLILTGYIITLKDLVEGGRVEIYDCSSDREHCMKKGSQKRTIQLKGLKDQIEEVYIGKSGSAGYIEKYQTFSNVSQLDMTITSNMPSGIHSMIQRLSLKGESGVGLAETFIREKSGSIALVMARQLAKDLMRSVNVAVSANPNIWTEKVLPEIERTEAKLNNEFNELIQEYGPFKEIMDSYNAMMLFDSTEMFINYDSGK